MFVALIDHDGNLRGIPIVFVVPGELEIPFEFAGVRIEGQQGVTVEIVAGAPDAAIAGRRIAGGPEGGIGCWIIGAGDPRGRAANFPGVGFPSFVAWFAGARNGVEAPFTFAGGGIVGVDEAPDSVFAARDAHEDEISDGQRREGNAVSLAIVKRRRIPDHIAGFGIERDDVGIERAEEYFVAENSEAAIHAAAAGTNVRGKRALVLPDRAARTGIESVGAVVLAGAVENSVHDERRGFKFSAGHGLVSPLGDE